MSGCAVAGGSALLLNSSMIDDDFEWHAAEARKNYRDHGVGTLRDWEQGAAEPDRAAKAYLTVIAREPEIVRKALAQRPEPA